MRCVEHAPARLAGRPEPLERSTQEDTRVDATTIAADVKAVIKDAAANAPRSRQVAIGPSEVGQDCTARLARKVLDWPTVNPGGDPLPSWVGTGAHAQNAEAFELANEREPGRWLVEQRVQVAPGLAGSCDLYDTHTGTVIDHKFVGTGSMRKYKSAGPSAVYRTQVHLYALGMENAGLTPKNVAIAFFPRGGLLSGLHVWTEPYNRQLALDAVARLETIKLAVITLDPEATPANWAHLPITPGHGCEYCPWYLPGSTDLARGCPSDPSVVQPRTRLEDLIA
ncbi:MAG: PD-(D/E)XK nuclease family protein [Actinoallomurus sp.]